MPHARGPHPRTRAPHLLQLVKGRGPVVYTRARSGGAPADLPPEVTWMHTADFHCPRHAGCRLLIFSPLPAGSHRAAYRLHGVASAQRHVAASLGGRGLPRLASVPQQHARTSPRLPAAP